MSRLIDFPRLLIDNGFHRGAEIGVFRGEFAAAVMQRWLGDYWLVDPWKTWPTEEYPDPTNAENMQYAYEEAMRAVAPYKDRVTVMRMTSEEAASEIPDWYFDWVYIDANHTAKYARQDIELWLPKVKSLGILAGHDYTDGAAIGRPDLQVKGVVDDMLGKKFSVHVIEERGGFAHSWWVRVP